MERYEPLDVPRGSEEPLPCCPECGGLLRRRTTGFLHMDTGERLRTVVIWSCDLHGDVEPDWQERETEEE